MTIDVRCGCGKRLRAADKLKGKEVRCPACGSTLAIPSDDLIATPNLFDDPDLETMITQQQKILPRALPTNRAANPQGPVGLPIQANVKLTQPDSEPKQFPLKATLTNPRFLVIAGGSGAVLLVLLCVAVAIVSVKSTMRHWSWLAEHEDLISKMEFDDTPGYDAEGIILRGKVMIFDRGKGRLSDQGTITYPKPKYSSLNSSLPPDLKAKIGDDLVTMIILQRSTEIEGKPYVEMKGDEPVPGGKQIYGGVIKRASAHVLYAERGKIIAYAGKRSFMSSTPDRVSGSAATLSAPDVAPQIIDMIADLPVAQIINRDERGVRLGTHGKQVTALAFSMDGRMIASLGEDRKLRLWDRQGGAELASIAVSDESGYEPWLLFSRDGKSIAAKTQYETMIHGIGTDVSSVNLGQAGRPVEFTPDGKGIWTEQGLFEVSTGRKISESQDLLAIRHDGQACISRFHNQIKCLVAKEASAPGWNKILWERNVEEPTFVTWLPGDSAVACVSPRESVDLLDANTGELKASVTYPSDDSFSCVAVSNGLVALTSGGSLWLQDMTNQSPIRCTDYPWKKDEFFTAVAISEDGSSLVVGLFPGDVWVYDLVGQKSP